jgi:hypothetical protein
MERVQKAESESELEEADRCRLCALDVGYDGKCWQTLAL